MIFVDTHRFAGAFVANRLDRLTGMIVQQGDDLLRDAGIEIPSRAVSLLLLVGEHGQLAAADIAATLGQPHQLVTQRADVLIDLAVVERKGDPHDGRRKILALTAKGETYYAKLQVVLSEAATAFAGLFEEIECDLSALACKTMEALGRASILDRINSQSPAYSEITARGCPA
jgi:DNA-binding MarR family transcriptional regulator